MFIYFDRNLIESKRGMGKERVRVRLPSRLHTVRAEPKPRFYLMNSEIMT